MEDLKVIKLRTVKRNGRSFEVAQVWISDICLEADIPGERMVRQLRKIADKEGVELLDWRVVDTNTTPV